LRAILGAQDGIEIVGEASDGAEAIAKAARLGADVVLMDVQMPGMDGLAATRELSGHAGVRVVVLTTFGDDAYLFEALRAGAAGFLLKHADPADIVRAVEIAHRGDALLDPAVTARVVAEFAGRPETRPPAGFEELTEREVEVLGLVARGRTNGQIADDLFVSEATVKTHVGRILLKLGLRDRVQVVIAAYEAGLVRPGDPR
jgi:DNA-binding NarL/FixJ family response regulator